ncbi:Hypothetical predicted protein, partial [Pelobates cultripes]
MGRNRRTEHSQNTRDLQPRPQQGTMDGFLHPPRGNDGGPDSPNPAPRSPVSTAGDDPVTLERISDELRTMAAAMATKADLLTLTTTIQDALRAEMVEIRAESPTWASRDRHHDHNKRPADVEAAPHRDGHSKGEDGDLGTLR